MRMFPLPIPVQAALARFQKAGFSAYVVGGCVRDSILGRRPDDWDIATAAHTEQTRQLFADCAIYATGESHGTLTVVMQGMPLEITVFRVEGIYSDGRRPDAVQFSGSLREDLARRDFTINAMAYHPVEGILDPFGGRDDLQNQVIRCVGEPSERFSEDALRILRALRFASVLGFSLHPDTAAAIHACRHRLSCVSAERVTSELRKLLCGKAVLPILLEFNDVFSFLIPELAPCIRHDQHTRYHLYDVYEHTAHSVVAIRPDPVLRMTMLLHDIGKPNRFFRDKTGTGHFKGHPAEGARLAAAVVKRMKLSNADSERILTLIRYHDAGIRPAQVQFWLSALGSAAFFELLEVKRADNAAQNLSISDRTAEYDVLEQAARELLAQNSCLKISDLAVNGSDLLEIGTEGPAIGRILRELLYQVVTGRCPNERQALLSLLPKLHLSEPLNLPPSPSFALKKATESDIPSIAALYQAVTENLARIPDNLCRGWRTGVYPVAETARSAWEKGELYLFTADGKTAGSAILNQCQPKAYADGNWKDGTDPWVIHTLVLHPDCRGNGAAQALLAACEREIIRLGGDSVRLDTFTYNQPAIRLYEEAGYRYAGTVDLGLDLPGVKWFRLYEKKLT